MFWTIERATGQKPIIVKHGLHYGAAMLVSLDPGQLSAQLRQTGLPLTTYSDLTRASTVPTSDHRPFLYLRPGAIPWAYFAVLLLTAITIIAVFGGRSLAQGFKPVLFPPGAGFLLIETRGITARSLLFGSTWIVNAAVIAGILVMALAANASVTRRPPRSLKGPVAALLASVVLLWWFDLDTFNQLPMLPRAAIAGMVTGLPVAFAGVIVSTLLARSRVPASALASNLLGSVLGGYLGYFSMLIGLDGLALLALVLYLGALYFWQAKRPVAAASA
ncbi:MAG: hypothetical protein H7343_21075 [Undibacterium sp.]|nr:hypothetical protein [Opitutaceae bacterium]